MKTKLRNWLGGLLAVLIIAPVCYFLSMGPISWLILHEYLEEGDWEVTWVPLEWLASRSDSFARLLFWYVDLWIA